MLQKPEEVNKEMQTQEDGGEGEHKKCFQKTEKGRPVIEFFEMIGLIIWIEN